MQRRKTSRLKVVIKELLSINYKSLFVALIWSYVHWVSMRLHLLSFKMMTRSALLNLSWSLESSWGIFEQIMVCILSFQSSKPGYENLGYILPRNPEETLWLLWLGFTLRNFCEQEQVYKVASGNLNTISYVSLLSLWE